MKKVDRDAQAKAQELGLSVEAGHVTGIGNKVYVTVAGLRLLALRAGIITSETEPVHEWSVPSEGVYCFKCKVTMPPLKGMSSKRVFTGYGSSAGSSVGSRAGGHGMLGHAETRAEGRALRKALELDLPLAEESGVDFAPEQLLLNSRPQGKLQRRTEQPQKPTKTQNTGQDPYPRKRTTEQVKAVEQHPHHADLVEQYRESLMMSKYSKEDSLAAIKEMYGASTHSELTLDQLRYITQQLEVTPPPVHQQPGRNAMFVVHIEWFCQQRLACQKSL